MNDQSRVRPFDFARDFTLSQAAPAPDPETCRLQVLALQDELAERTASIADEVAAARRDGFAAGLAQARGEQQVALLAAVDALHAAIEASAADLAAYKATTLAEAAELALAAAAHMAGQAIGAQPLAPVVAALELAWQEASRGPELTVRVNPALVPALEAHLAEQPTPRNLALLIVGDGDLAIGDARLAWDSARFDIDAEARRQAVTRALAGLMP